LFGRGELEPVHVAQPAERTDHVEPGEKRGARTRLAGRRVARFRVDEEVDTLAQRFPGTGLLAGRGARLPSRPRGSARRS
jgi:hypothetical protein